MGLTCEQEFASYGPDLLVYTQSKDIYSTRVSLKNNKLKKNRTVPESMYICALN